MCVKAKNLLLPQEIFIEETYNSRYHDWNSVKTNLRDEVSKMMYEKTKRNPMILPVIMEV